MGRRLHHGSVAAGAGLAVFACVIVAALPSRAAERAIAGQLGFLAEWEITGALAPGASGQGRYSGAIRSRHTGLCGPGGPEERAGEISLRLARADATGTGARYSASLTLAGEECVVEGAFSREQPSFAVCANSGKVPLRLWLP